MKSNYNVSKRNFKGVKRSLETKNESLRVAKHARPIPIKPDLDEIMNSFIQLKPKLK